MVPSLWEPRILPDVPPPEQRAALELPDWAQLFPSPQLSEGAPLRAAEDWARAAEHWILAQAGVPPAQWGRYTGRGRAPRPVWRTAGIKATEGRVTVLGETALVATMARIREHARLATADHRLELAQVTRAISKSWGSLRQDHARAFGPRLTHFGHLAPEERLALLADMDKALGILQRGGARKRTRDWRAWVAAQAKQRSGAAIGGYIKEERAPPLSIVRTNDDQYIIQPAAVAQAFAN